MAQNAIYGPWEGTKGPWLCSVTTLFLFGLLCFPLFLHVFMSLIKPILWLKFSTAKCRQKIWGARTIGSCFKIKIHMYIDIYMYYVYHGHWKLTSQVFTLPYHFLYCISLFLQNILFLEMSVNLLIALQCKQNNFDSITNATTKNKSIN